MFRTLRFKVHETTPLRPFGSSGKYIGNNPFNKKKDDLIVDDYHDYIIVKSDSFAGTWWEFQKHYYVELSKLMDKGINFKGRKKKERFDLVFQRKLFKLDNDIDDLSREIKKFQKRFEPILDGSKNNIYFYDTEFDMTIQFHVSRKHSAYNPNDDNIMYEDDFWNGQQIEGIKYELDRREEYYFKHEKICKKYQKKDWSAITYYLYNHCSREDIMCIDYIFVGIKPEVQLSKYYNKTISAKVK